MRRELRVLVLRAWWKSVKRREAVVPGIRMFRGFVEGGSVRLWVVSWGLGIIFDMVYLST